MNFKNEENMYLMTLDLEIGLSAQWQLFVLPGAVLEALGFFHRVCMHVCFTLFSNKVQLFL
jgi:hypothetical protein